MLTSVCQLLTWLLAVYFEKLIRFVSYLSLVWRSLFAVSLFYVIIVTLSLFSARETEVRTETIVWASFESLPGLIIRLFPSRPDRFGAHAVFYSLGTENSLLPEIKTVNSLYSLQRLRKCQIFLPSFFYVHWELTFNHFCEKFVLHDMKRYRHSMCYLLHVWDKEAAG